MGHLSQPIAEPQAIQPVWNLHSAMVMPPDRLRFVNEARLALGGDQNDLGTDSFWKRFEDDFLATVRQWCEQHGERVAACYVPFPRGHLRVFVVSRSATYDFSLSDEITALEMDLFQKHWASDVNQVPLTSAADLEALFSPTASIQVYGHAD